MELTSIDLYNRRSIRIRGAEDFVKRDRNSRGAVLFFSSSELIGGCGRSRKVWCSCGSVDYTGIMPISAELQLLTAIGEVHVNEPVINKCKRQIEYLATTITGENKTAWLLKAINFIDLTTLSGDDTENNIEDLCKKATKPMNDIPIDWDKPLHTAAVCVYPSRVPDVINALKKLEKTNMIKVASVAAGFPSGQYPLETRLQEVRYAMQYGAQEIDIVINRSLALKHDWLNLYRELQLIRNTCDEGIEREGKICLKVILSTGELFSLKDVYKASLVAMFAGADFIKTSTGKETVNATLPVGIVMCRAIKEFQRLTGLKIGFKPAGGIKTTRDVLQWMVLIKEELGNEWLCDNRYFRIGASSLLDNIICEICNTNKLGSNLAVGKE
ncbi:deoxyribose-phosphate aldolase isoform X2 [Pseudomyrmex gracilis]|uniref:deoxyribose-phosphate aldolase isoform X2 n=1 Tax=Pseudomyrmex gracilis TaxID=219809 RepID=UPI0009958F1B|nr:deoxyribose-phosphate aldolase isoform X2 [Pseudomyrmex gracilis]